MLCHSCFAHGAELLKLFPFLELHQLLWPCPARVFMKHETCDRNVVLYGELILHLCIALSVGTFRAVAFSYNHNVIVALKNPVLYVCPLAFVTGLEEFHPHRDVSEIENL